MARFTWGASAPHFMWRGIEEMPYGNQIAAIPPRPRAAGFNVNREC